MIGGRNIGELIIFFSEAIAVYSAIDTALYYASGYHRLAAHAVSQHESEGERFRFAAGVLTGPIGIPINFYFSLCFNVQASGVIVNSRFLLGLRRQRFLKWEQVSVAHEGGKSRYGRVTICDSFSGVRITVYADIASAINKKYAAWVRRSL
jgi:hypothetical protein